MNYAKEKEELIFWARRLNEKGFVASRGGNISYKVKPDTLLITAHDAYLGQLAFSDILLVDLAGHILEGEGEITSEKTLHLGIHKRFPQLKVVLHAHPAHTVAYFHYFKQLEIFSFEARFYLGNLPVIAQVTPTVVDVEPVISALEDSQIVVLSGHGVISVGEDFRSAFGLIELLEEQAKVGLLIKAGEASSFKTKQEKEEDHLSSGKVSYKLLSSQHINKLVELVNGDETVQDLGRQYDFTCSLAVKNEDSGDCVCFYYDKGRIVNTDQKENADFLIIAKPEILKKIFNRQIDPFVAVTQGKVKAKGDFSKLSRWYPVMVRTFKLWEEAPVE